MIRFDPEIFGCPSPDPYSYTKAPATTRLPALQGRPRYRLKDTNAAYIVTVTMDFSEEQMGAWQTFWDATERGTQLFIMPLMLSDAAIYYSGEEYPVRCLRAWDAGLQADGRQQIGMELELPGGIAVIGTLCDVIYGGPIVLPAPDDIYGGPITMLAEDIVAPCPGVDPNG